MLIFNKMFRKASLDCNISVGLKKREREREPESERVREHHVCRAQE